MEKILGTPRNGWTNFTFGPFHIDGVSYLTEVHWDLMEFFADCLSKEVGIIEFDCEENGRYLLTYSSFGMELRNPDGTACLWHPDYMDITSHAIRLLTDLIFDFNYWVHWTAMTDDEVVIATEDLAMNLENFCQTLISHGILDCQVSDMLPEPILYYAANGREKIAQGQNALPSTQFSASGISMYAGDVGAATASAQMVPNPGDVMKPGGYSNMGNTGMSGGHAGYSGDDVLKRQMEEEMRRAGLF